MCLPRIYLVVAQNTIIKWLCDVQLFKHWSTCLIVELTELQFHDISTRVSDRDTPCHDHVDNVGGQSGEDGSKRSFRNSFSWILQVTESWWWTRYWTQNTKPTLTCWHRPLYQSLQGRKQRTRWKMTPSCHRCAPCSCSRGCHTLLRCSSPRIPWPAPHQTEWGMFRWWSRAELRGGAAATTSEPWSPTQTPPEPPPGAQPECRSQSVGCQEAWCLILGDIEFILILTL